MTTFRTLSSSLLALLLCGSTLELAAQSQPSHPIILHAARLLDIKNGRIVKPGEILIQGERILEAGSSVKHPAGAVVIDL